MKVRMWESGTMRGRKWANLLTFSFSLLLVFCILFSSCKVNYSMTGASISPDIKTFTVKYFTKTAALGPPLLSQVFTERLKQKFISQTNLSSVDKNGDLIFEGAIINYMVAPI